MKSKYLIIALGLIIIITMLVIIFMPVLTAGLTAGLTTGSASVFSGDFRFITMPLLIFLGLFLVCICVFFCLNYRLLSLLEREDWPALAYYLEHKIYVKGRFYNRYIRILTSSYFVISDYQSVLKLESKVQLAKPSLISGNVLIFGTARIFSGKYAESAAFFKMQFDKCKPKDKQWVRWFYGFSQLLAGNFNMAESEFASLAVSSSDALITGLSAYFLCSSLEKKSLNPDKCLHTSDNGRNRVIKSLKTSDGWMKETQKMGTDIHIAIIKKYLDEAGRWLFSGA